MNFSTRSVAVAAGLILSSSFVAWTGCASSPDASGGGGRFSPCALAASPDGKTVYVAGAEARRVAVVDLAAGRVRSEIPLPAPPTGLALSSDGARLYATCADPAGRVAVIDTAEGRVTDVLPAGHGATGPALSPDGTTLYVCNRFENSVSALDPATKTERWRAPAVREPFALAVSPDGRRLFVANHLPAGRTDDGPVAVVVTLLDAADGRPAGEIALPNGSTLAEDVRISPDGTLAAVTHLLARFRLPATQIERGWIMTNAVTLIDAAAGKRINTFLLDDVDRGAAYPWGAAWSPDGKTLYVAHAGTHEVSAIDVPGVRKKLDGLPSGPAPAVAAAYAGPHLRTSDDVPDDLSFLVDLRRRVPLGPGINGPRAIVAVGDRAVTAGYFSDTIAVLETARSGPPDPPAVSLLRLRPPPAENPVRLGERIFNDASICFQGWQSCASCHGEDGRVDGLNWDLLNDGLGNPKNTKSLLLAHRTPPTSSLRVRESAEVSVRAGIRHILFAVRPESEAAAMDAYLKSLRPLPPPPPPAGSPGDARRGEKIFRSPAVGCAECHPSRLLTDLKPHDVDTLGPHDAPDDIFDTPTLAELWRTAPYLHDGSAETLDDVLRKRNPRNRHGRTSHLTREQLDDLIAYLKSL